MSKYQSCHNLILSTLKDIAGKTIEFNPQQIIVDMTNPVIPKGTESK